MDAISKQCKAQVWTFEELMKLAKGGIPLITMNKDANYVFNVFYDSKQQKIFISTFDGLYGVSKGQYLIVDERFDMFVLSKHIFEERFELA